jgi:hypothetical protein
MQYRILLLCDFNRNSAGTIIDHATSFQKFSSHELFFFNPVSIGKPGWLKLDRFDLIVIHYSIYVLGDHYINATWREAIAASRAVKVQFIQDEYRTVHAFHGRMRELGIDILFTCIPEPEIEKMYPSLRLPGVKKVTTLTGYIPDYMEKKRPDFDRERTIDVGYRGRNIKLWWLGELFQEKTCIAEEFSRRAEHKGIQCNISCREEDRIYGEKWIAFLENCRCTLGTESGASIIDFDGTLEGHVRAYIEENPAATFREVHELFLKEFEGKVRMNQISPRIFEAIGCGCCLILFEGEYSGIIQSPEHFITLNKDFSNFDEVVDKIKDRELVKRIAERAYEDVVTSGRYSYRAFIENFDSVIEEYMKSRHGTAVQAAQVQGLPVKKTVSWRLGRKVTKILFFLIASLSQKFRWFITVILQKVNAIVTRLRDRAARRKLVHPFFKKEKMKLLATFIKDA